MDFCKAFNAQTKDYEKGTPLPVVLKVFSDRSFTFIVNTPPASYLIKKAIGLAKGSSKPNTDKVGKITKKQLQEIATIKTSNLTAADTEAAMRTIAGTARSMGVTVEG
jgi:large subunit ribosomal protein L11